MKMPMLCTIDAFSAVLLEKLPPFQRGGWHREKETGGNDQNLQVLFSSVGAEMLQKRALGQLGDHELVSSSRQSVSPARRLLPQRPSVG